MPTVKPKNRAAHRAHKTATVPRAKASDNRVTVRLKPELAEKLAEARREQGLSVTEVVETALERHFMMNPRKPRISLLDALKEQGLLGAVDMGPDASVRVKEYVGEYLDKKYPHR